MVKSKPTNERVYYDRIEVHNNKYLNPKIVIYVLTCPQAASIPVELFYLSRSLLNIISKKLIQP